MKRKIIILGALLISYQVSAQFKAYGVANNVVCIEAARYSAKQMAQETAISHCQSLAMQLVEIESRILGEDGQGCWSGMGYAGAAVELTYYCMQ